MILADRDFEIGLGYLDNVSVCLTMLIFSHLLQSAHMPASLCINEWQRADRCSGSETPQISCVSWESRHWGSEIAASRVAASCYMKNGSAVKHCKSLKDSYCSFTHFALFNLFSSLFDLTVTLKKEKKNPVFPPKSHNKIFISDLSTTLIYAFGPEINKA